MSMAGLQQALGDQVAMKAKSSDREDSKAMDQLDHMIEANDEETGNRMAVLERNYTTKGGTVMQFYIE